MMHTVALLSPGQALVDYELDMPIANSDEILLQVEACGLCRTDLHILDQELPAAAINFPLVLGHQIVGLDLKTGRRFGVPWLGSTCGNCEFCLSQRENLCNNPQFTGYTVNGGLAEYCVAKRDYCIELPNTAEYSGVDLAPLLCAGLIGYRAYNKLKLGKNKKVGFYGFGSSAHILIQIAKQSGQEIFAFTRPGDVTAQKFALSLGAVWAGDADLAATKDLVNSLDGAIIFASVGDLVPMALKHLKKGGRVVCAGIHMSDIPSFSYDLLWGERSVESVANLTRQDGEDFFKLLKSSNLELKISSNIVEFNAAAVNAAFDMMRTGKNQGPMVVKIKNAN